MMRSVLALALMAGLATAQDSGYSPGKIEWVKDPQLGLQQARLEGKAAMLYFTASW